MSNPTPITYRECRGQELEPFIESLAQLRIDVFKAFPYLYNGTLDYEKNYLKTYIKSPHSFVTLACLGDQIIGATTAILASDEESSFQEPFKARGIAPESVCYFGESILLPEYRGLGIGKEFMNRRLHFARNLRGVQWASFCAVIRPTDHPLKPSNYRSLDSFWQQMGFRPVEGMLTEYSWLDVGETAESTKKMQFWMRTLEDSKSSTL